MVGKSAKPKTKGKGTGSNPNSKANLKPIKKGQLSSEELKKRQSNGGKASAKKKRFAKDLQSLCKEMLAGVVQDDKIQSELVKMYPDHDVESMSYATAMVASQLVKAVKGNAGAFQLIADYAGMRPAEVIQVEDNRKKELSEPSQKKVDETIKKLNNL